MHETPRHSMAGRFLLTWNGLDTHSIQLFCQGLHYESTRL